MLEKILRKKYFLDKCSYILLEHVAKESGRESKC